ncbi:S9 family peptidase [Sphingomonas sp. ID1715]|uniref:S9 family peptidase n=1 Tax=Sphingomonas sp. ID1715 TaxID=1656898 RepID=UPI0014894097|nr:S9 family peptidase [Sphingomonas sp. ID1715]NNM76220.1 S9 family peptidase [Sphingomonas sp. ID1715]
MTHSPLQVPLIERAKLFGNPTRAQGRISPDGRWLSWLAPRDGVMNLWLAPAGDPADARPMTAETARPIGQYLWAPDSRSLLYVQDKGGDENFLLYRVDIESGAETCLTPFENTRVLIVGTSVTQRGRILVGLNNRDPQWHDVHTLDLATGELTELMRGDGFAGFLADDALTLRVAVRPNAEGGMDFHRIEAGAVADAPFAATTLEDALTTQPVGFTTNGRTLYWLDSRGRNTAALIAETDGQRRVIAEDARADIGDTLTHPLTGEVEAYSVDYLTKEWIGLDLPIGATLKRLRELLEGDIEITSRTDDDRRWTVAVDPVTGPPAVYLYDRQADRLDLFYVSRPELEHAPLVPMHALELRARDGLTLTAYLSLPHGSATAREAVPDQPLPMVLLVHGGPWARDHHGYNPYHQWLANRGYAVLSVNFRGSTGFGKGFISAGDLEWGARMHDDLVDAVEWAVAGGIADRERIAIMGGSYGGYATLVGLTFTPELFACGVDIVGPSNLETLLQTIPPYWKPVVQQFHRRMGNPETPEGLQLLKDRSPLHKADRIVRPLLIGQGANDPRVKQAESDQIASAMKAGNIPLTYVLFPDEGHGVARPENNIAFNAITEEFLSANLGGRCEPAGETLAASTAQFLARA